MILQETSMADFQYDLPEKHIAQFPLEKRDQSKLLVYKNKNIQHVIFSDLANHLPSDAHLVFNDTKVIPARLIFSKSTGAKIEIFLLEPFQPSTLMEQIFLSEGVCIWHCTVGNKKKWKNKESLFIHINGLELNARLLDTDKNLVEFSWSSGINFGEVIKQVGNIPLPPYMNRAAEDSDSERYQTIFANLNGAVAAPTASLHFTQKVLQDIELKGVIKSFLTLHVGAGTFLPVKVANAQEHEMHSEQMVFSKSFIENLFQNHAFVIPAGTTAMRSLESLFWFGCMLEHDNKAAFLIEKLYPYNSNINISLEHSFKNILNYMKINDLESISGNTEIMIMPGYSFKVCKGIITNFHQPGSTLLLLIGALIGKDYWLPMYNEALAKDYRFLSYGDSSLLIP
jgi:S-adenosylmethionine:tRNA ribosyltransferase-isomerase